MIGNREMTASIEWKEYPRIPAGEYRAYCKWGKQYRDPGFKKWLVMLRWDIAPNGLDVLATVPQFFHLGNAEKPRASRRGNYLKEWATANGAPPVRRDRLSPQVFLRRWALVEVVDTDSPAPYSVVRRVIQWETGSPRGLVVPGQSVNKSHSPSWQEEKPSLQSVCGSPLSTCSASALAGVEGANNPTHTRGAGLPIHRSARQRQPQHTTTKDYESAASLQAADFTTLEMSRDFHVTNPERGEPDARS